MKIFATLLFFLIGANAYSQLSEDLVPKESFSVFSVNNISLLQKISLDELVKYEFMEEVQQELFDGSTSGKTLKDSGIDFAQKLNVFYGKSNDFELAGFTFGITNHKQLFEVFDDFEATESEYKDVKFYWSYSNWIAIKGDIGILLRVTPTWSIVEEVTDSIWYAQGNGDPWDSYYEEYDYEEYDYEEYEEWEEYEEYDEEGYYEEGYDEYGLDLEDTTLSVVIEVEETKSVEKEEEYELPPPVEILTVENSWEEESADDEGKSYWELRDSVEMVLQKQFMKQVCDDIFVKGDNLLKSSEEFKEQLTHDSEGIFYFDNSTRLMSERDFRSLRRMMPTFYGNIKELYEGNIILGDLVINDHSIELQLEAKYGDKLGSIYEKLSDAKFDKNVMKYIHKDNSAFFTYQVNLREAYEQAYDVIVPIMEEEGNKDMALGLLVLELYDEFLNKDAIFDTYKGSLFGAYNGIQKVKTKKIIFHYDEETYDYTEEEVEAEEDMPLFVFGISTDRNDLAEKILKFVSRIEDECRNEGDYWVFDDAILNSVPLYMILKNDLFIFTNDEDLAKNHSNGYGKDALSKSIQKKAKKSGITYGYADLGKAIENLPRDVFSSRENEMIDVVRGKTGTMEFTSSETTSEHTSFNLIYNFEGDYEESGTYILDLINSLYVVSK